MAITDIDRAAVIDANFIQFVTKNRLPQSGLSLRDADVGLDKQSLLELFESQIASRHCDLQARELKRQGKSYYTIGSSGHEGNAAVALAFRFNDTAFLHYRSGAFMIQRAKAVPGVNIIHDILLSLVCSKDDPIASGRHKVFGSVPLFVPPQTSTIASHLPKAVGFAGSIKRAQLLKINSVVPEDSVVLCSFGDATINHSTAMGAFNTAQWMGEQRYPLPIVFVCEDNGIGVSVRTPPYWVESNMCYRPSLKYIQADGLNVLDVYRASIDAERIARVEKRPVFLHLKLVRLLGHAGSDHELHYRSLQEIEADELNDPLLHSARIILEHGYLSQSEIISLYESVREKVRCLANDVVGSKQLSSAKAVMKSIIPPKSDNKSPSLPSDVERKAIFGVEYAKLVQKRNLCQNINSAITDLMLQYKHIIVLGEDVARKGGVYRVTANLCERFRKSRVFDSLLDEQSILGYAIGHAQNGFLPMPEIQFLAYYHNAQDQIRGEAATLSFFSNGQYTNPMVLRIASLGYQKGFGGHFHNDNSIAVLRDVPGIIIACPSNGRDAAMMLRECVRLAYEEQRVVVFLEPIALYMEKDLYEKGDQGWLFEYPALNERIKLGELGVYGDSNELTIITYGNGHYLSQQAAKILCDQDDIEVKIIDLRWLAPLNEVALLKEVKACNNILIVDECRRTGSQSEQIATLLLNLKRRPNIKILAAEDSFISLGKSWQYLLPSRDDIIEAVREMLA